MINALIEITKNDLDESKLDKISDSIQVDSNQVRISSKWNLWEIIDRLDSYPLDICIVSEVPIGSLDILIEVRVKKRVLNENDFLTDKIITLLNNDAI